jgi:hypothetical protein
VHYVDDEVEDEEGNEICVAEWVEKPRDKPISCSFLKPNGGRRDKMKYTFDMSKCDRLFDLLLWGGIIRLTEGHVIPNVDILAKKTYCKWHDSYTHTTNECNYFRWQVQLAINNGWLTLGDGGKTKLDTDPFPVGMVELELKKILVRTDQAKTIKGKNMIVSDDLRNQMIKPHNSEVGVWKENVQRKSAEKVNLCRLCWLKNINTNRRRTGGTGSLEGSSGTYSLMSRTDQIGSRHDVHGSLGGG